MPDSISGETVLMQALVTYKGRRETGGDTLVRVNQPAAGYVDAKDHKDVSIHTNILAMSPATTDHQLKFHIQTASGVAGQWKDILTYTAAAASGGAKDETVGRSTGAVATALEQLERFLRFSIDPTIVEENADWSITFEVWVNLK